MGKKITIMILAIIFFTTISLNVNNVTSADDPIITGRIYGQTFEDVGWQTVALPFVIVKTTGKQNLSDLSGNYSLNGLTLNQVYEITAKKIGYKDTVISVYLSDAEPEKNVDIQLLLRDSTFQRGGQGSMRNSK